jgi:hypothetical protein
MDNLTRLMSCGNAWFEEKACIINDTKLAYDRGEITAEEFKELLQDISYTDELVEDAAILELKAMLFAAVYGITQLL